MRRFLLTISFDGTNYHGWQVQKNAVTIQQVLQNVLKEITGPKTRNITGCSRTDAGVHARMFCCHFDTDSSMKADSVVAALNSKLPRDIAAIACEEKPSDFHARYSARGKNYVYRFFNSRVPDPFLAGYSLQIKHPLDDRIMNLCCKDFLGSHDFSGFCSSGGSVSDTVRTVTECSVTRSGDVVEFSVTANGFLYNMVRIMAGTLLEISRGGISGGDLPSIIQSCDRNRAGATLPAHGLFLNKVFY